MTLSRTSTFPEKMEKNSVIPTLDTARFNHIYASSKKCSRPLLITGPHGVGKSITVWSKLTQKSDEFDYKCHFLPKSDSKEFKTWMTAKLHKREQGVYGPPPGAKGTIMIDDLNIPSPDKFNDVSVHEALG